MFSHQTMHVRKKGVSFCSLLCRPCRREGERRYAIQGVTTQGRDDVPGHLGGDSHLPLDGRCSQMWGGNHAFVREHLSQDGIVADRLLPATTNLPPSHSSSPDP